MGARKKSDVVAVVQTPDEVKREPRKNSFDGSIDSMAQLCKGPAETAGEARFRLIQLLQGEPDMARLVETFHVISRRDRAASIDDAVTKSGVNRSDAFGAIARVLHRYNFDIIRTVGSAIAAARAPEVFDALIDSASSPDGSADRRLFMEVTGMRESGGGMRVNIHNEANAAAKSEVVEAESEDTHRPRLVPMPLFEKGMKSLAERIRPLPVQSPVIIECTPEKS